MNLCSPCRLMTNICSLITRKKVLGLLPLSTHCDEGRYDNRCQTFTRSILNVIFSDGACVCVSVCVFKHAK